MLARNLQAGVLTELSWPALEKAMADFWKRRLFKKDKPIKFFESYPGVVALRPLPLLGAGYGHEVCSLFGRPAL